MLNTTVKFEALIDIKNYHAHPLTDGFIEIGRDASSKIRLESPAVSRHHARIHISAGRIVLFDLGSTNGTFVNGKRVVGGSFLHGGDKVTIGMSEFIVAA